VSEDLLARILRYSIANGLFVEQAPGVISHSASSAALVRNPHLSNIVHFGTEFLGGILLKVPTTVLLQRDDPENAVEAAFNIAYSTDQSLFEYLQGDEDLTRKYHEYLAGRVNTPLWSVDRLRAAWPWASKEEVTVVDVIIHPL
jgi:6-hydroxytryprostatin B O-methyltransferase